MSIQAFTRYHSKSLEASKLTQKSGIMLDSVAITWSIVWSIGFYSPRRDCGTSANQVGLGFAGWPRCSQPSPVTITKIKGANGSMAIFHGDSFRICLILVTKISNLHKEYGWTLEKSKSISDPDIANRIHCFLSSSIPTQ